MTNIIPFKSKDEQAQDEYESYCSIIRNTPAAEMTFDLARQAARHWSRFLTLYHEAENEKINRLQMAPHFPKGADSR